MKVVIRYAKQDSKDKINLLDGFIYTAELTSDNEISITKEIQSIYDDYKGDYLEQYMEPKATVFCCYLLTEGDEEIKPENYVFKSDISKKMDPIAILDGLVRRMKADKISMSDGYFIQTFEDLKVDDNEKENLVANKYVYESIISDDTETTGKNVRFMLSYRDTANISDDNFSYNQRMVSNCIPFCFLLKGEIVSDKTSRVEIEMADYTINETHTETTIYRLNLEKQKVILEDRVLWLLNGEIMFETTEEQDSSKIAAHFEGFEEGESGALGLFYSSLKAENFNELKLNTWYSLTADKYGSKIARSRIEDMIAYDKYVNVDPFAEFTKNIHKQIVRKLKTYGMKLYEPAQNGKESSDDLTPLSPEQSKAIIDRFEKPDEDPIDVVNRIDAVARKYLKGGTLCNNDTASFTSELCKYGNLSETDSSGNTNKSRPLEHSFSVFRTAVHEVGHALVQRQLFGSHTIDKITVVRVGTRGGVVLSNYNMVNSDMSKYVKLICIYLGGKIAEELCFGVAGVLWRQDMWDASGYMIYLIQNYATFDMKDGRLCCYLNSTDAIPADDALNVLMDQYMEKTKKLLESKKEMILELAENMLLEKEVTGEHFEELCNSYEEKK